MRETTLLGITSRFMPCSTARPEKLTPTFAAVIRLGKLSGESVITLFNREKLLAAPFGQQMVAKSAASASYGDPNMNPPWANHGSCVVIGIRDNGIS
jgi:hypothetical protein